MIGTSVVIKNNAFNLDISQYTIMYPSRLKIKRFFRNVSSPRTFSSHKRNYLDNWVGTPKNARGTTDISSSGFMNFSMTSQSKQSLQVMGSSYLLPTLRLPRNASASSLSTDLSSFLEGTMTSVGNANSHAVRSMLKPKQGTGNVTWRVPIIIDLAAFQHDGSPHYIPPPLGFLSSIVSVFDEWGIAVMGVTNAQTVENVSDEIASLSLPVLGRVGSGRTLGRKANNSAGANSVDVEELVQLVLKKVSTLDDDFAESPDADSGEEEYGDEPSVDGEEEQKIQPTLSREEILDMPFRQLQTECKTLGLVAIGATGILQDRLLEFYGHNENSANDETIGEESIPELPSITAPTKIYHGSVRSGQQVSTDEPNQSLIIMGNVNSGGEVMADGDIYVFGTLRGRALAGLAESDNDTRNTNEDNDPKIICSHFDAELICIGETFTTVDSMESVGLKEGAAAIITRDDNGLLNFNGF